MKSGDPSAEKVTIKLRKIFSKYTFIYQKMVLFQIAALENEIEERWTDKSAKMVANCEQKWKRKFDEIVEERDELSRKVTALNEKVHAI